MKKYLVFFIIFLGFSLNNIYADSWDILELKSNKKTIWLKDNLEITLTLKFSSSWSNFTTPELSIDNIWDNFQIVWDSSSSSFEFINWVSRMYLSRMLYLRPLKTGSFEIWPWKTTIDSKEIISNSIKITVDGKISNNQTIPNQVWNQWDTQIDPNSFWNYWDIQNSYTPKEKKSNPFFSIYGLLILIFILILFFIKKLLNFNQIPKDHLEDIVEQKTNNDFTRFSLEDLLIKFFHKKWLIKSDKINKSYSYWEMINTYKQKFWEDDFIFLSEITEFLNKQKYWMYQNQEEEINLKEKLIELFK